MKPSAEDCYMIEGWDLKHLCKCVRMQAAREAHFVVADLQSVSWTVESAWSTTPRGNVRGVMQLVPALRMRCICLRFSHTLPPSRFDPERFALARETRPGFGHMWNYLFWVGFHWNGIIGNPSLFWFMVLSPKIDLTWVQKFPANSCNSRCARRLGCRLGTGQW